MSEITTKTFNRKSIRLPDFDYSTPGAYFITICSFNNNCFFGRIRNEKLIKNDLSDLIDSEWQLSFEIRENLIRDVYQIMPNHFHAVVFITSTNSSENGAGNSPIRGKRKFMQPASVSSLVAGFKSSVTTKINRIRNTTGTKIWQRNYYEHVIRNESDLDKIRNYIVSNPLQWKTDKYYTE